MDNPNYIKIYFRVFIYKIIVLKMYELFRKEIKKKNFKNHGLRMKTRLGARTESKNLEGESKMHPNTKVYLASKSTIWHFWSAERHFKSAKLVLFGLWPNALRVTIRHTLFNLFAKGWVLIHILHFGDIF